MWSHWSIVTIVIVVITIYRYVNRLIVTIDYLERYYHTHKTVRVIVTIYIYICNFYLLSHILKRFYRNVLYYQTCLLLYHSTMYHRMDTVSVIVIHLFVVTGWLRFSYLFVINKNSYICHHLFLLCM